MLNICFATSSSTLSFQRYFIHLSTHLFEVNIHCFVQFDPVSTTSELWCLYLFTDFVFIRFTVALVSRLEDDLSGSRLFTIQLSIEVQKQKTLNFNPFLRNSEYVELIEFSSKITFWEEMSHLKRFTQSCGSARIYIEN